MNKETLSFSEKDVVQQKEEIPKGHPPLKYLGDGKYQTPEGEEVVPQFLIGEKEYHRQLFVEYELSFGRGKAFDQTHFGAFVPGHTPGWQRLSGMKEEYQKLTNTVPLMNLGTEEQCKRAIEQIRKFRAKYPELYTDAEEPQKQKKKFKIVKERKIRS